MFVVSFDKSFTSGTFAGMTIRQETRFGGWAQADAFVKMCDGKTERTTVERTTFTASRAILEAVQPKAAA